MNILFDLDGTLTDPGVGIVSCIRYALERLGRDMPADQALLRLSQRAGMKMVVKRRVLSEPFREVVEGAFPLMVSAGALEFETNHSPLCPRCPVY